MRTTRRALSKSFSFDIFRSTIWDVALVSWSGTTMGQAIRLTRFPKVLPMRICDPVEIMFRIYVGMRLACNSHTPSARDKTFKYMPTWSQSPP